MSIFGWLLGYVKLRMIVREFKKVPKDRIISKLIELTDKGKINWKVVKYGEVTGDVLTTRSIITARAIIGNSRTSLTFTFNFTNTYIDIFRDDGSEIFDYKLPFSTIDEQCKLMDRIEDNLCRNNIPLTDDLYRRQQEYKLLKRIFK